MGCSHRGEDRWYRGRARVHVERKLSGGSGHSTPEDSCLYGCQAAARDQFLPERQVRHGGVVSKEAPLRWSREPLLCSSLWDCFHPAGRAAEPDHRSPSSGSSEVSDPSGPDRPGVVGGAAAALGGYWWRAPQSRFDAFGETGKQKNVADLEVIKTK